MSEIKHTPRPKKERRDADLILVGTQMSNVLYNLKQRTSGVITAEEREQFGTLQTKWDITKQYYLKSFKRRKP